MNAGFLGICRCAFDLASKVTVACSRRHLWIQSLQVLGGQSHCGGISSAISACEMNGAIFPWKKNSDLQGVCWQLRYVDIWIYCLEISWIWGGKTSRLECININFSLLHQHGTEFVIFCKAFRLVVGSFGTSCWRDRRHASSFAAAPCGFAKKDAAACVKAATTANTKLWRAAEGMVRCEQTIPICSLPCLCFAGLERSFKEALLVPSTC